jgi:hypothetical protein
MMRARRGGRPASVRDGRQAEGEEGEEGLQALDEPFKALCKVANAAQWDSAFTPPPPPAAANTSNKQGGSGDSGSVGNTGTGSSREAGKISLVPITQRHTPAFTHQGSQLRDRRRMQVPQKIAQYPTMSGVRLPQPLQQQEVKAATMKKTAERSISSSLRDEEEGEMLAADLFGALPGPGNMTAGKAPSASSKKHLLGELSEEAEQALLAEAVFYVPPATNGFAEGEELQEREQSRRASKAATKLHAKSIKGGPEQHKGRILPAAHTLSEAQEDELALAILERSSTESGFAEGEELREKAIRFAAVPSPSSDWTALQEEEAIAEAFFGPDAAQSSFSSLIRDDALPSSEKVATSDTRDPEDDMSLGAAELALLMHTRGEVPIGSETPAAAAVVAAAAAVKGQKKEQVPLKTSKKADGKDGGEQGGSSGKGSGGHSGGGGGGGTGGGSTAQGSPPDNSSAKKFWREDVFNRGNAAPSGKSKNAASTPFSTSKEGPQTKANDAEGAAPAWHTFFPFHNLHREHLNKLDSFVHDQQARLRNAASARSTMDVKFGLHAAKMAAQSIRRHHEALWMFPYTDVFGNQAKQNQKRPEKQDADRAERGEDSWQYDHVFHAWRPLWRFGDRNAWWR